MEKTGGVSPGGRNGESGDHPLPPVSGFSVAGLIETWFSAVDAPADQGRRLKSPLIRSQRPRRMATFR